MNNPTLETIINRRSIRDFQETPVSDEAIQLLVAAAQYAPSARDRRPCHFVVVTKRAVLDQLRARHPYATMLEKAPACLVVCGDETASLPGYYMIDCAAATQNILLAAKSMGLGSCWLGVAPREERMAAVAETLALPPNVRAFSIVAIGYARNEPPRPDRLDESRIHRNGWGE